jgi:hypothetical protein
MQFGHNQFSLFMEIQFYFVESTFSMAVPIKNESERNGFKFQFVSALSLYFVESYFFKEKIQV